MSQMNAERKNSMTRWLPVGLVLVALMFTATAHAAAPGITGPTFNLSADTAYITQPDGAMIYSWGYGCSATPTGYAPAPMNDVAFCNTMQVPGPTLIVTEGQAVKVTLTNHLPAAAGNTSILFPGFQVTATGGVAGLLTQEAAPGGSVTYSFTAGSPGTRAYYSGTQGDLQVEMGLYGVIIVLPSAVPAVCDSGYLTTQNKAAQAFWNESDFRLAHAAYDHDKTCYDREYLFQFSAIDPAIHRQVEEQVSAKAGCVAGAAGCSLNVATEPYHPAYFMVNGRSMPDLMDANYAPQYPHQPYNGDPHMHPGENVLVRVVGQDRWQHPFHEHGNHLRTLGRDGNLIVSETNADDLAGPLLFTTTSTPGQAYDGIFYWTGKGLNWDVYGHTTEAAKTDAHAPCTPDANGYYTADPTAINYYEWCQDHNHSLEAHPFGDVGGAGPVTLPDPNILANGAWFGGSPYLGPNATTRATFGACAGAAPSAQCGTTGTTPPSGTVVNPPSTEAGFAFMWHSHNERELTTNNIFPGGMMMMMLVDSREFVINEIN
jgi:FtsP/CotA-like multicopper oxidase with cupredoxin domain